MAKKISSIRITEKDKLEYNKMVSKAKRKIRNVHKKYGIDLSTEVQFPKLGEFNTREDFNKWKEKQTSFTNRNNLNYQFVKNEHGIVASKARINKITRDRNLQINVAKQILKDRASRPEFAGGKKIGTVGQRMQGMARSNDLHVPKPFNFKDVKSFQRLLDVERNANEKGKPKYRDERTQKMQDVFIRELITAFGDDANYLVMALSGMKPDEFYDMYDRIREFDYDLFYRLKYLSEDAQYHELGKLERELDRYQRGDYGVSLKGF